MRIRVRPTVSANALLGTRNELPFPLGEESGWLRAPSAKTALARLLPRVGLAPGSEVLVPAWHDAGLLDVLARAGLRLRAYATTATLEPDAAELDGLASGGARALLLVHHLGFPLQVGRWRAWCDERGLLLVEDATTAWLACRDGIACGALGDVAVLAPGATLGLPLALAGPSDSGVGSRADDVLSAAAARLLTIDAAARRRAHFRLLADALGELLPAPFDAPTAEAVPWAFPVQVPDKLAVLTRLRDRGIDALDLRPSAHPAAGAGEDERAAELRRTVLALPVHQNLGADELARVADAVRPAVRRRPAADGLRLERVDGPEDLRASWDPLALAADNLFATWDWQDAWWRHFGDQARPVIVGCRRADGSLAAILPLCVERLGGVRVLRFVGHGPADQLGPICAPADVPAVTHALHKLRVGTAGEWDVLHAPQLPREAGWATALGGRTVEREEAPVIRLAGVGWDEFLQSRSANFRQQVRRRENKLTREHGLAFRLTTERAEVDPALDLLIALHRARWADDGTDAFAGPAEAFHHDLAARAADRGRLRLWVAELEGHPAAAWYGFRWNGSDFYYQAGRDPAWDHGSPGLVLLAHTVRDACAAGAREYRLLRGDEPFKFRFATHSDGLETVVVHDGGVGHAAGAADVARRGGRSSAKACRAVARRVRPAG